MKNILTLAREVVIENGRKANGLINLIVIEDKLVGIEVNPAMIIPADFLDSLTPDEAFEAQMALTEKGFEYFGLYNKAK